MPMRVELCSVLKSRDVEDSRGLTGDALLGPEALHATQDGSSRAREHVVQEIVTDEARVLLVRPGVRRLVTRLRAAEEEGGTAVYWHPEIAALALAPPDAARSARRLSIWRRVAERLTQHSAPSISFAGAAGPRPETTGESRRRRTATRHRWS